MGVRVGAGVGVRVGGQCYQDSDCEYGLCIDK